MIGERCMSEFQSSPSPKAGRSRSAALVRIAGVERFQSSLSPKAGRSSTGAEMKRSQSYLFQSSPNPKVGRIAAILPQMGTGPLHLAVRLGTIALLVWNRGSGRVRRAQRMPSIVFKTRQSLWLRMIA